MTENPIPKHWYWTEIDGLVTPSAFDFTDFVQCDMTRGVTMYRSSRGHVGLEVLEFDAPAALARFNKWAVVCATDGIRIQLRNTKP